MNISTDENMNQFTDLSQVRIPRTSPLDTKTNDLQNKIVMRFIPTSYLLHKMGKVNHQVCSFCNIEPETIELFFQLHLCTKYLVIYVFRNG